MYIKIDKNIVTSFADFEFEGSQKTHIEYSSYSQNPDKYKVIDGELVDISNTEEYLNAKAEEKRLTDIESLKKQITELDLKRIRALCESDSLTGEKPPSGKDWLEYYTAQIVVLREKLSALEK